MLVIGAKQIEVIIMLFQQLSIKIIGYNYCSRKLRLLVSDTQNSLVFFTLMILGLTLRFKRLRRAVRFHVI